MLSDDSDDSKKKPMKITLPDGSSHEMPEEQAEELRRLLAELPAVHAKLKSQGDAMTAKARRLADHMAPAVMYLVSKIAFKERENVIIILADGTDKLAEKLCRAILERRGDADANDPRLATSCFYTAVVETALRETTKEVGVPWPPYFDQPLERGDIRLFVLVEGGNWATSFTPGLGSAPGDA